MRHDTLWRPKLSIGQKLILVFCLSCSYALTFSAESSMALGTKIEDFRLLDSTGKSHSLYYLRDKKAIVIWALAPTCALSPAESDAIVDAYRRYAPQGVQFFFLTRDPSPSRIELSGIQSEDIPILNDEGLLVTKSLGLNAANEVVIIDPISWRGMVPANTRAHTAVGHNQELLSELGALVVAINSKDQATNCWFDFSSLDRKVQDNEYVEVVAPILQQRCLVCHQEGGIGPWAMTSHAMIQGFAPMIKEVLATRRMPPWQADPAIGHWRNDQSLSVAERIALVNWIDAGAPRGEGDDPLLVAEQTSGGWPLGEPDLIIELPSYEIPASGVVEYRYPVVPNPLNETVWVKAATVRTNVPSVLHHVLVGAGKEQGSGGGNADEILFNSFIQAYAPGTDTYEVPVDTGIEITPEDVFLFQNHYTTDGLAHTEKTELGLYLHASRPQQPLRHSTIINKDLKIPAFAAEHEEDAYFIFPSDATLYGLMPHAHYRGKTGMFKLIRTNGSEEVLLSVPNYDFNWQRVYLMEKPAQVRAGDRLSYSSTFDNSLSNSANPDPAQIVKWGEQSFEEMLYGGFLFSWSGETFDDIKHDKQLMLVSLIIGYKDTNRDGLVQPRELPLGLRLASFGRFGKFDKNNDGGWSAAETSAFITWIQSVKWLRPFLSNV